MALPFENYQRFSVQVTLAAADASKTLVAADPTVQIAVTHLSITGITAAAQTMFIGDSSATNKVISYPNSQPSVGTHHEVDLTEGLRLVKGEALIIKPNNPGPSIHVVAEGYLLRYQY